MFISQIFVDPSVGVLHEAVGTKPGAPRKSPQEKQCPGSGHMLGEGPPRLG